MCVCVCVQLEGLHRASSPAENSTAGDVGVIVRHANGGERNGGLQAC